MGRELTLGTLFERLGPIHRQRPLYEEPGRPAVNYLQAADRVRDLALGMVAAGVGAGDRVVVATPNGYDQLLLCAAASRAGGIAVPVNPHMRAEEIAHVVADSGAALVVHDAGSLVAHDAGSLVVHDAGSLMVHDAPSVSGAVPPATLPPPGTDSSQVAAIFYTSGTTGRPKGVRLTHRALLSMVGAAALWPAALRRDEAVVALPVAHIMGFSVLVSLACAGIPVYDLPRFDGKAVLDAIEERRATMFVGVPAMYRMLLEAGAEQRDLRSVRAWASGADVMPIELARRFQAMGAAVTLPLVGASVGEAAFLEGYGMVETGGGVVARVSPPGLGLRLPNPFGPVLGFPIPPNRLRVVGEDGRDVPLGGIGELWVKGPHVLEGYHGDEAATAAVRDPEGWVRTGDLVRRGLLGVVSFVGRAKDVIKSGGYSVYAAEVERVLEEHPDVAEAAVVGVSDERMGQVPAAAVRLRPDATLSPDGLRAWAGERLSSYKVPRRVRMVESLPRTGTDKVAKRRVAALFRR
jgi:acyl-CoA synthetase (AMP-forming)/AMP-acid ligase II